MNSVTHVVERYRPQVIVACVGQEMALRIFAVSHLTRRLQGRQGAPERRSVRAAASFMRRAGVAAKVPVC